MHMLAPLQQVGLCYLRLGRRDRAEKYLRRALEISRRHSSGATVYVLVPWPATVWVCVVSVWYSLPTWPWVVGCQVSVTRTQWCLFSWWIAPRQFRNIGCHAGKHTSCNVVDHVVYYLAVCIAQCNLSNMSFNNIYRVLPCCEYSKAGTQRLLPSFGGL